MTQQVHILKQHVSQFSNNTFRMLMSMLFRWLIHYGTFAESIAAAEVVKWVWRAAEHCFFNFLFWNFWFCFTCSFTQFDEILSSFGDPKVVLKDKNVENDTFSLRKGIHGYTDKARWKFHNVSRQRWSVSIEHYRCERFSTDFPVLLVIFLETLDPTRSNITFWLGLVYRYMKNVYSEFSVKR